MPTMITALNVMTVRATTAEAERDFLRSREEALTREVESLQLLEETRQREQCLRMDKQVARMSELSSEVRGLREQLQLDQGRDGALESELQASRKQVESLQS
jgi:hypothetical protein